MLFSRLFLFLYILLLYFDIYSMRNITAYSQFMVGFCSKYKWCFEMLATKLVQSTLNYIWVGISRTSGIFRISTFCIKTFVSVSMWNEYGFSLFERLFGRSVVRSFCCLFPLLVLYAFLIRDCQLYCVCVATSLLSVYSPVMQL